MRIAITGANGYIGSRVVKHLCDSNIYPYCIDINNDFIDKRAHFIKCDILNDYKILNNIQSFDILLHLAWRNGFIHNSDTHMKDLNKHIEFLKFMVDNGIKTLAVMGTMHEIGYYEGCVNENTQCNPLSEYGKSKLALRNAMETYCLKKCNFMWLRAYYIYGNEEHGNSIFSKIISAAKNGDTHFPFNSGKNKYDFIYIDDLVSQICTCIIQDKVLGIIDCCSGKPMALGIMVENFIKSNDLKIKLDYGLFPDRPYDSPCIYGDNTKISKIMRSKIYGKK